MIPVARASCSRSQVSPGQGGIKDNDEDEVKDDVELPEEEQEEEVCGCTSSLVDCGVRFRRLVDDLLL